MRAARDDPADDLAEQAAALGADADTVAAIAEAEREEQSFDVYADAWNSWRFFVACRTQWRHGFNGPTGLDYTAVRALMALLHAKRHERDELFADVTTMEAATLDELRIVRTEREAERKKQAGR